MARELTPRPRGRGSQTREGRASRTREQRPKLRARTSPRRRMKPLAELRSALEAAVEAMESALRELENPQEGADIEALQRNFDAAKDSHRQASEAYQRAVVVQEARAGIPPEAAPVAEPDEPTAAEREHATPKRGLDRDAQKVGGEPLVYTRRGHQLCSDMYKAHYGDQAARERLDAHKRQVLDTPYPQDVHGEQRAAITQTLGEGGELIAPVYLQEQWVGVPRAGRPIA